MCVYFTLTSFRFLFGIAFVVGLKRFDYDAEQRHKYVNCPMDCHKNFLLSF